MSQCTSQVEKTNSKGFAHSLLILILLLIFAGFLYSFRDDYLFKYQHTMGSRLAYLRARLFPPTIVDLPPINFAPEDFTQKTEPVSDGSSDSNNKELELTERINVAKVMTGDSFSYLKDGVIWTAYVSQGKPSKPKILVKDPKKIVDFDISPNGKLVVYSVKRHDYKDRIYGDYAADTVLIKNLETDSTVLLHEVDPETEAEILSLAFAPNGKRVLFTNNALWSAEIGSYAKKSTKKADKSGFCRSTYIEGFSQNSDLVLLRNGCYEGSFQEVLNLNDMETVKGYSNGYVGGGTTVVAFTDNEHVLTLNNTENTNGRGITKFYINNLYGESNDLIGTGTGHSYRYVGAFQGKEIFASMGYTDILAYDKSSKSLTPFTGKVPAVFVTELGSVYQLESTFFVKYADSVLVPIEDMLEVDSSTDEVNAWYPIGKIVVN